MHGFDLYQGIGGTGICRKLSVAFYRRVAEDSVLRPLFPGKSLRCAIEQFAAFLAQIFGGPSEDAQRRWWLSLRESHLRFEIRQPERDAWMRNMVEALDEVQIQDPVRGALLQFFRASSSYLVNTGPAERDVENSGQDPIHQEIAQRWNEQLALDEALAAIRGGEMARAITLADGPVLRTCFARNRAVFANLLALMVGNGHSKLEDYVESSLLADPALVAERFSGRTLIHAAAAASNLKIVELLFRLGADPNITDSGSHAPLYSLANECKGAGEIVVRALIQSGADVNACDGVKRCTALHMAARRGNVAIAEALLDCGAEIECRDSLGDTPLRRAVNCGKTDVAASLLSRGADRHSRGSKGLTPASAARTAGMRDLMQSF